MSKERNQHLHLSDTVRLRFYSFNGGDFKDPQSIHNVEIYSLFTEEVTEANPYGSTLLKTIDKSEIVKDKVGEYHVDLQLSYPTFTVGQFRDVWHVVFEDNFKPAPQDFSFQIFASAWFTDCNPIVHDFSFEFMPNRVVHGSKKYITILVNPDVPRGSDKRRYYENLISGGELFVSLQQKCGECMPDEEDLRLILENEPVTNREQCKGYYFLDTTELECGIYDMWFTLNLGPNVFISDKQNFQVFH